jgi:hypothetical protein
LNLFPLPQEQWIIAPELWRAEHGRRSLAPEPEIFLDKAAR